MTSCYPRKANAANFKTNKQTYVKWQPASTLQLIKGKESKMTDSKGLLVCLRTNSNTHTHTYTHTRTSSEVLTAGCCHVLVFLCPLFKSSVRTGPVLWAFSPRHPGPLCERPWWAFASLCDTPPLLVWLRGTSWAWALWFAELMRAAEREKKNDIPWCVLFVFPLFCKIIQYSFGSSILHLKCEKKKK